MVTAHQNIERWGKGLGLRLPAEISETLGLQVGQRVSISIESQSIIVTPCEPCKPCEPCEPSSISLADRLAQFDPVRHGGEIHLDTFSDAIVKTLSHNEQALQKNRPTS